MQSGPPVSTVAAVGCIRAAMYRCRKKSSRRGGLSHGFSISAKALDAHVTTTDSLTLSRRTCTCFDQRLVPGFESEIPARTTANSTYSLTHHRCLIQRVDLSFGSKYSSTNESQPRFIAPTYSFAVCRYHGCFNQRVDPIFRTKPRSIVVRLEEEATRGMESAGTPSRYLSFGAAVIVSF